MKKVISVILVIACITSVFSSCAQTVEEKHLAKGEFFNIFLNSFNYYPDDCTLEEMNGNDNYDVEAATMVSWGILSEDEATKGLDSAITKEIAVLSCFNAMTITKEGNTDDIKDADLCKHPQEMANAYATGIVELENGYINGQEKLTLEECNALIEKTMSVMSTITYDEDECYEKYGDIYFTDEDLEDGDEIYLEGYDDNTSTTVNLNSSGEEPIVSFMGYSKDKKTEATPMENTREMFQVEVSVMTYAKIFGAAKPGDVVVYNSYKDPYYYDLLQNKSFIGRFVSAKRLNNETYSILMEKMEDIEKVRSAEIKKMYPLENLIFEDLQAEIEGYKLDVDCIGGKLTVNVNKTLTLKENKYNNWRDAEAKPTVDFTATIDNFCIKINNLKGFFDPDESSASNGFVQITCDTMQKLELNSGLLRLAPDSNRNGKFWSNLTNSRFTTAEKGATEVKIARLRYPAGPIVFEFYVFLDFHMDGKITIRLEQFGNGVMFEKKAGKLTSKRLLENKTTFVDINANLDMGVQMDVSISVLGVANVISGNLRVGFTVYASMQLYYEENGKEQKDMEGCGDPVEASEAARQDPKLKYCFDHSWWTYFKGGLSQENLIGEVADAFDYDISKWSFTFEGGKNCDWLPYGSGHFEETGFVDKCTRGDSTSAEEAKNTTEEDKFLLSEYKVYLPQNTCDIVYITYMPVSAEKIEKKYKGGIKVRVKNKSIVEAEYMESNNSVMITAIQPGSTEVEVYVQKDKKSGKEYLQSFSVTVQGDTNNYFTPIKDLSASPWEKIFEA